MLLLGCTFADVARKESSRFIMEVWKFAKQ